MKNRKKGCYEDNKRWWIFLSQGTRDAIETLLPVAKRSDTQPDLFEVLTESHGPSTVFSKEPGFRNPYSTRRRKRGS